MFDEQLAAAEPARVASHVATKVVKPGATVTIAFDDQTDHAQTIKVSNRENAPQKGTIIPASPPRKA